MRKKAVFPVKKCMSCGTEFDPTSPVAKFCPLCAVKADRERKEKWYAANHTATLKTEVLTCSICDNPFYSRYNGIPCCQKHYNTAYETGDPNTDRSRKSTNSFSDCQTHFIGTTTDGFDYYFDKGDYENISKHSWCVSKSGYLVANIANRVTRLHRLIMNAEPGTVVDHINGNPLDNRKSNLRITDNTKNVRNSIGSKRNVVGARGISATKNGKFRARIMVDRKEIRLGIFDDLESAIEARRIAEIEHFKEFAPTLCRK